MKDAREFNVCLMELGSATAALASVANQGRRDDNVAAIGGIAVDIRRAAHRMQFGSGSSTTTTHGEEDEVLMEYRKRRSEGVSHEAALHWMRPAVKTKTTG